ncbi:hypothetical protein FDECE_16711 [Fusarium decemcellulare]|nr:hypothetical protein FDECE_16711 [Fusarium decemcellulare]
MPAQQKQEPPRDTSNTQVPTQKRHTQATQRHEAKRGKPPARPSVTSTSKPPEPWQLPRWVHARVQEQVAALVGSRSCPRAVSSRNIVPRATLSSWERDHGSGLDWMHVKLRCSLGYLFPVRGLFQVCPETVRARFIVRNVDSDRHEARGVRLW